MEFANITLADHQSLKRLRIEAGPAVPAIGRKEDLAEHLEMIRQELSGCSMILFYHAWLIVGIRRQDDVALRERQFFELWKSERDFLLQNLNARWLVSACDTMADVSPDRAERSVALAASLLANTVKLYETERLLASSGESCVSEHHIGCRPKALFDGMTTFAVGAGDMIRNLIERCARESSWTISGAILLELLRRMNALDTVFRRLQRCHRNPATRWEDLLGVSATHIEGKNEHRR